MGPVLLIVTYCVTSVGTGRPNFKFYDQARALVEWEWADDALRYMTSSYAS